MSSVPPDFWQACTAVSKSGPRPVGMIATTIANMPPRLRNVFSASFVPCNAIMLTPRPMSAPTKTRDTQVAIGLCLGLGGFYRHRRAPHSRVQSRANRETRLKVKMLYSCPRGRSNISGRRCPLECMWHIGNHGEIIGCACPSQERCRFSAIVPDGMAQYSSLSSRSCAMAVQDVRLSARACVRTRNPLHGYILIVACNHRTVTAAAACLPY